MATVAPPNQIAATLTTSAKTSDVFRTQLPFDVIVRGTFVANLRLQMSRDEGSNWDEIYNFTAAGTARVVPVAQTSYRLTMAGSGDFTSGSAGIFIGR